MFFLGILKFEHMKLISKVLSELKSKEIVECINEEARKGRLYRLTDTGKDVLETIKEKEEKEE